MGISLVKFSWSRWSMRNVLVPRWHLTKGSTLKFIYRCPLSIDFPLMSMHGMIPYWSLLFFICVYSIFSIVIMSYHISLWVYQLYMYVYIHIYTYIYILYIHTYIYIYTHLHIHIYIWIYLFIYTYYDFQLMSCMFTTINLIKPVFCCGKKMALVVSDFSPRRHWQPWKLRPSVL